VGPGPGLTMVWAFVCLIGTIGLAVLYLLIWPLRLLIRRMRGATPVESQSAAARDVTPAKSTDTATVLR
jgi:hypothetical protein